ncbi:MAG: HEAT repeat domain-containing protein [Deltaproteobacteria bacterium]|jgi:HEAT repeat protein|nr:HEAT repeat domain-containing protein [Deltaproteobacteria bacterium]
MSDYTPVLPTRHHNLMQWIQPEIFLRKVLRVYPNEIKPLIWVTAIQLVMSSSAIQINNFAQSAFLKRFGVQSLPTVFLVEAIITLFFSGLVGIFMERYRNVRVFTVILLYFGGCIGLIRLLLPLNFAWLYPVLYILKSQSVAILPILYWDILSDLFTVQQSKRLFTLVTAGGVMGTTAGSLMTGRLARWLGLNNLLLIFVAGMVLAAVLNELTEKIIAAPMETRVDRRKGKLEGKFANNFQEFLTHARESILLKYMILIIAIPNILLPIMDYQFNVVVDHHFTTEAATLHFFGLYRGVSNAAMFVVLMVSGRIITRLGITNSLLFHPVNYFLAFGTLFLRFDIISGIYARFSTETLKTTLNNPARTVLYNFFPEQSRALIRVFLRGAVVRISDFTGSGLLILIKGLMDPRWLSIVAAPLVFIWLFTNIRLKKAYPSILLQTLADKHIDWPNLEDVNLKALLKDKRLLNGLKQKMVNAEPKFAVFYSEILAAAKPTGWMDTLLDALSTQPLKTQKQMLSLLDPKVTESTFNKLVLLTRSAPPELLSCLLETLTRIAPKRCSSIMESFLDHSDHRVQIEALSGVYLGKDPQNLSTFRNRLNNLLNGNASDFRMGVEILSKTGDGAFENILLELSVGEDPELKAWAITGLSKMEHNAIVDILQAAFEDPSSQVRKTAVEAAGVLKNDIPLEMLIKRLTDPDPFVRSLAAQLIQRSEKDALPELLSALYLPSRVLKNEVLSLLNTIGVPAVMLSSFIVKELKTAYGLLAKVKILDSIPLTSALALCRDHLLEKHNESIEIVLRGLGFTVFGDRMKLIIRAIQSGEKRDVDNAIEALESSLHTDIRRLLMPLLGEGTMDEKLAVARESMRDDLPMDSSLGEILKELVGDTDPVIRTLGLYALGESAKDDAMLPDIRRYARSENQMVKDAAGWVLDDFESGVYTKRHSPSTSPMIEKIRWIRQIPLFTNLRIQELLTHVSLMTFQRYAKNDIVFREGMPLDYLYLIFEGQVSLITGHETKRKKVLEYIGKNQFFGELALIDGKHHPYTAKVESDAQILMLKADDFLVLLKNSPSVSLNLCKVLSLRLRDYQSRLGPVKFEHTQD